MSKVCHYVGSFFHYLLANSTENEEEKSVASVSAILFFILALQTGILIFKKKLWIKFLHFLNFMENIQNNFCEIDFLISRIFWPGLFVDLKN